MQWAFFCCFSTAECTEGAATKKDIVYRATLIPPARVCVATFSHQRKSRSYT